MKKRQRKMGKAQRKIRKKIRELQEIFSRMESDWEPFEPAVLTNKDAVRYRQSAFPDETFKSVWRNNRYQVLIFEAEVEGVPGDKVTHLSIKRLDQEAIHDWRDLQRIKNELCGPEREAAELYPAESRLVDTSNQYHLWVLPEGIEFPFGFPGRAVSDTEIVGNKQRPFEEPPEDLIPEDELREYLEKEEGDDDKG